MPGTNGTPNSEETTEAASRSHFLTALGWACIVSGLYVPARVAFDYWKYWEEMLSYGSLGRYPVLTIASNADVALQGALSVAAGWGLVGRRRWAPWVSSFATGALLADVGWALKTLGPRIADALLEALKPEGSLGGVPILATLVTLTRLALWLTVFGAMSTRSIRLKFPQGRYPFTTKALWLTTAAGAAASALLFGGLLLLWRFERH